MNTDHSSRRRILTLWQALMTRSDRDHRLTTAEMMQLLEDAGYNRPNDRTLAADLLVLQEMSVVVKRDSRNGPNSAYYDGFPLTEEEVQLLVQAVTASPLIPQEMLGHLVEALLKLVSAPVRRKVKAGLQQADAPGEDTAG